MTPTAPTTQPQADLLDFTDKYNTPIPAAQQPAFDQWATTQQKTTGKDPRGDRYDYDVNGYFLSGAPQDPSRGHGPDTFKKPNHPTFSDESQYNGLDGYVGGSWTDGGYKPSVTNVQFHGPAGLQTYFKTYEPNTKLLAPDPVPSPSGKNGQYRISDFRPRPVPSVPPAEKSHRLFGQQ